MLRSRVRAQRTSEAGHVTAVSAPQLSTLREQGFLIIPELLGAELRGRIRRDLEPWLRGERWGRNEFEGLRTERVYALLAKSSAVAKLVEHPLLLGLVDRVLPRNYLLSALIAINVHPGETAQRAHRDDGGDALPLRHPRPALGVSAMWALDDFTASNGATELVPGSHSWTPELRPHEQDFEPMLMPAGSLLVFLGNVLHRGGANRSDAPRLGITPQFCAPRLRQIENMVLSVPSEIAARHSPRIQALLGYSVIDPGFMGHVDGMHPRRLIDPAYRGRKARGITS